MAKGAVKIYGNLGVSKEGNVITLRLNQFHAGQPYALFTEDSIPELIKFLKQFQRAKPEAEDEDWRDLI